MGYHPSRQLGGAGEFVDFREYSGGEDLRRLDWKVLARTGKAFVRMHEEETNLVCTLAIDASGSMRFARHARANDGRLETGIRAIPGHGPGARDQPQPGPGGVGRARSARCGEWLAPGATASHVEHLQQVIEAIETRAQPTDGRRAARAVRALPPPRRAAADQRLPHGRPGGGVRRLAVVPASRLGYCRSARGPSRRGAAARGRAPIASRAWRTRAA